MLKGVRTTDNAKASGQRRKEALDARRALGDGLLTAQGIPKSAMPFLSTQVFSICDETKGVQCKDHTGVAKEFSDEAACGLVLGKKGTESNLDEARKLIILYGERLAKGSAKLIAVTKPEEDNFINFIKLTPKSGDEVNLCDWVPTCMGQYGEKPVDVDSWACPWLYHSSQFGARLTPHVMLHQGVGSLVAGYKGSTLVLVWPMQKTMKANADIAESVLMLSNLTVAKSKTFLACASWMAVEDPRAIWLTCRCSLHDINIKKFKYKAKQTLAPTRSPTLLHTLR